MASGPFALTLLTSRVEALALRFWSWLYHWTVGSLGYSIKTNCKGPETIKNHDLCREVWYSSYQHLWYCHAVFALLCDYALQICDFGLAKWTQQAATQTATGKRRGTVAYMPPEVFRDASLLRTVKYDVYSFGILLWELLSGKRPFEDGININSVFSATVMNLCSSNGM